MLACTDAKALIDDPRVLRVAVTDTGEPLAETRSITTLAVDHSRADFQQLSDNPFQLRAGVAERLVQAQAHLPDGYQLQIKEGGPGVSALERWLGAVAG